MTTTQPEKTIEEIYNQLDDIPHVLLRPNVYIGPIIPTESNMWIMAPEIAKINPQFDDAASVSSSVVSNADIISKKIEYVPGFYKIFDEIIVNARDHIMRQLDKIKAGDLNAQPVTNIETTINPQTGEISIKNDGSGIPVQIHKGKNKYVPELIFANLRSGENFNDDGDKRLGGGQNGYGSTLAVIYSLWFTVETVDHLSKKKYVQTYRDNLSVIEPPVITSCANKPYTKFTFLPDYARLNMTLPLNADIIGLLHRRVYDIAGVTKSNIKIKLNGDILLVKDFKQYVKKYFDTTTPVQMSYEISADERWEYAVTLSNNSKSKHMTFVNGIYTKNGGKHLDYIANQICKKIKVIVDKKNKVMDPKNGITPSQIKNKLFIFIRCDIVNAMFEPQTKDILTTAVKDFGSTCEVSDKFIKKIIDIGLLNMINDNAAIKSDKLAAASDGKRGIRPVLAKYNHSPIAGTARSKDAILCLTEGDSALAGYQSGLGALPPDEKERYGSIPLRGKLPNRSDLTADKIAQNAEYNAIKAILGLEEGKEYLTIEDVWRDLNYGQILIMCDQDSDGSHIRGLIYNFFYVGWPSLFKIDGFLKYLTTQIVKATKNGKSISFYTVGEYNKWLFETPDSSTYEFKQYKGLGTSTAVEWKDYMRNLKVTNMKYTPVSSENAMIMSFGKKSVLARKDWLLNVYDPNVYLESGLSEVTYEEYVNKDLIHYAAAANIRGIPNVMDGLKPSQRKVIYGAFKRNLKSDVKVVQLSGYCAEHSAYHHGDSSINGTIIGMAQNYTGSQNIAMLVPSGQFGTRTDGGKDSASPRYIFTRLDNIARFIFRPEDDIVLKYLTDDGMSIEPEYYCPIIPMISINSSGGIGMGYSSDIFGTKVQTNMMYLKNRLNGDDSANDAIEFEPYYEGFKGIIIKLCDTKWLIKGTYEKISSTSIRITELPIDLWCTTFKEHLMEIGFDTKDKDGNIVKRQIDGVTDRIMMPNDNDINWIVDFLPGDIDRLEAIVDSNGVNGIEKLLKLTTTKTSTNFMIFKPDCTLGKCDTIKEMIDMYYVVRFNKYADRKAKMLEIMTQNSQKTANQMRFIVEIAVDKTLVVNNRSKTAIITDLIAHNYMAFKASKNAEDDDDDSSAGSAGNFNYLLDMKIHSMSLDKIEMLRTKYQKMLNEIEALKNTSIEQMWLSDLAEFEVAYDQYLVDRLNMQIDQDATAAVVGTGAKKQVKMSKPRAPRAAAKSKK